MCIFTVIGNRLIGMALLCLLAVWPVCAQQTIVTNYVYDNNGRLRAVIAPDGQVAIYDYDPAGNITGIRRLTSDGFELLAFFPDAGKSGDTVVFRGIGLHTVTAVSFNGTAARVVLAEATRLIAEVPPGVTTGPITLTSPRGTLVTPLPFTVRGVTVSPHTVSLNFGQRWQFTALVLPDSSDPSVTWSVNGVPGGNSVFGTITATGKYAAPNAIFSRITVRATSVADPGLTDDALVMVGVVGDTRSAAGFAVSSLSVGRQASPPPATPGTAIATALLVGRVLPPPQDAVAAPTAVISVGREQSLMSSPTVAALSAALSVGREPLAASPLAVAASSTISASKAPLITATSPGSVARGASNIPLMINGRNLNGAVATQFITASGLADANLTITNRAVSADGTTLTAVLAVSTSAVPGSRLIVVMTPGGSSQVYRTGQNMIEITP